jgi:tetratricopeptide (TPR) repeat protein
LILVAPFLLAASTGLSWWGYWYLHTQRQLAAQSQAWSEYHQALERHDFQGLEAALQTLLRFDPPPAAAKALYEAWTLKRSTSETLELAPLLMDYHLRRTDLPAATQEAEQVLRRLPRHWLAHCVRLHAALNEQPPWNTANPPPKIIQLLEQFPDPEDEAAWTTPAGLLYALRLWKWAHHDTSPLLRVLDRWVLPLLRTAKAQEAPSYQQLHLIACWLAVAEQPEGTATPSQYWAAVDQLSELAVQQAIAKSDAEALRYWLALAPALEQQLLRWQRESPQRFPASRITPLQQEVRRRRRLALDAWHSLEPQQPEVYFHLAELAWQEQDIRGAYGHYLEALRRCPDPVPVWERFLPFLTHFASESSLRRVSEHLWREAEQTGQDAQLWCLAAQAAAAVQLYEHAMEACRRARQIQAGHPTVCLLEATLWLRSGDSVRARTALESLDPRWLRQHPEAARLYGRCLAATSSLDTLIRRYQELFPSSAATDLAVAAFLRGAGENSEMVDILRWAVRELQTTAVRGEPLCCRYYTELRFRLAEALVHPHPSGGPAVWDAEAVAAALYAFQTLSPEQLREPDMLLAQATLYAFGRQQPEVARRLIEPLFHPPSSRPLTPAQQLALAYILLASQQARDALPLLTALQQSSPSPPAALWIALAWAYRDLGEPQQAATALDRAALTPYRSAREQADWVTLKHRIFSGKPP